MQWWVKMQPSWRGGESLVKTLPEDADWEPVNRGGSNGLSVVIMALSWWVAATKNGGDGSDGKLHTAISDMTWVLSQLIAAVNPETGTKRGREPSTADEPESKRWVPVPCFNSTTNKTSGRVKTSV
jgi:hypothetical protein